MVHVIQIMNTRKLSQNTGGGALYVLCIYKAYLKFPKFNFLEVVLYTLSIVICTERERERESGLHFLLTIYQVDLTIQNTHAIIFS